MALALGGLAAAPAGASCRLALALGFDVSASVDEREYRLMMAGTAAALRDDEVVRAVLSGPPVALAAFVWAGSREQAVAAGWTLVDSAETLRRFADRVEGFARPTGDPLGVWAGRTGVGAALAAGGRMLARAPECDARTLDLAGDGVSNDGPDSTALPGITVNGLAIGGDLAFDHSGDNATPLSAWYAAHVIQGPGAFVMVAQDFRDFARAIRLKLLRELRPMLLGALR